jgi:hypothetical protein
VSAESLALLSGELGLWVPGNDPDPLLHAASEHIGASRPIGVIIAEYAAAREAGDHGLAHRLAEELVPVRQAHAVLAGGLPGLEPAGGDPYGMD